MRLGECYPTVGRIAVFSSNCAANRSIGGCRRNLLGMGTPGKGEKTEKERENETHRRRKKPGEKEDKGEDSKKRIKDGEGRTGKR